MEWISVEDRLPPETGYYQVCHARRYNKLYKQIVTSTFFDAESNGWMAQSTPSTHFMPVTHWMPLPEPPMEAEHEPNR